MAAPPPAGRQLDLGKTIALFETDSVRAKIKNWQTTGGGILSPDDVAVESEKSDSGTKSDGKRRASKQKNPLHAKSRSVPSIEVIPEPPPVVVEAPKTPTSQLSKSERQAATDPQKPRVVERKPNHNRLDAEVREAIAPPKRIVSDGHWRRKRLPAVVPKPPSPPKPKAEPAKQLGWVRPPLLPRPTDEPPPSPPKPEPKPIITYKARTKSSGNNDSRLSKRTEDSVPMRAKSPTTPRPIFITRSPKASTSGEDSGPAKRDRSRQKKSSGGGSSRPSEDNIYASADERLRNRLTKSRTSGDELYKPRKRRSLSAEDASRPRNRQSSIQSSLPKQESSIEEEPPRKSRPRQSSVQKSLPEQGESVKEKRRRSRTRHSSVQESLPKQEDSVSDEPRKAKPRRRRRTSDESVEREIPDIDPAMLARKLSNYDDEAEKRRETFRGEFAQYVPPREKRSSGKKKTTRRFSYSPEGVDRVPEPTSREPVLEAPQRQTSHRIEEWLVETPDPFKESASEGRKKSASSRRDFSFEGTVKSAPTESTIDTETTITESTIEPRSSTRKYTQDRRTSRDVKTPTERKVRAKSEPSDLMDPDIEVEYSSTTSVPTLKRSGARHGSQSPASRERGKPTRTVSSYTESDVTTDVTSSVMSSSIDPRGFDMPGDGKSFNVARRLFPSTGKRLSTIVSVETLATKVQQHPSAMSLLPEAQVQAAPDALVITEDTVPPLPDLTDSSVVSAARSRTNSKRKLTRHSDLMTVLSIPASRSKSVVSARSIRTHKSRLETASVEDLMKELVSDETKYMRELRTLADGVIPVLLKCVLSRDEAAVAAGLFKISPHSEKDAVAEASRAIHDMSVAIQRLKSLHTRIPKENHFSLQIWAQSAYSVYEKYIKTWRLGFQDVVVSLASDEGSTVSGSKSAEGGAWDQGLPRNEDGYIVDAHGERVDVAFLLKRPLVRLKYLSKTMKGINIKKPSEQSSVLAKKFETLMEMARSKVDEEKARLEDDAAALIDATRARDPKSLAPLAGVTIDATRCVRARDYFDLHLPHSSGQTMDCRLELLARDDAPGRGKSGDILICEVDETGRWLLFPPVEFKRISARAGDEPGEIIVMIRGVHSGGEEWDEVFTLSTGDEEVRFEWIQMLGLSPTPPPLNRTRSFKAPPARPSSSHASSSLLSESVLTESTSPRKSRTPSPRQIDIPIGERASSSSKRWSRDLPSPRTAESDVSSVLSSLVSEKATLYPRRSRDDASSYTSASSYTASVLRTDVTPPTARRPSNRQSTPKSLNDAMAMAGAGSPVPKRARATRYRGTPEKGTSKYPELDPRFNAHFQVNEETPKKRKSVKKTNRDGFSVWIPNSEEDSDSEHSDYDDDDVPLAQLGGRLSPHHRTSSVPSMHLPSVSKTRKHEDEYMSGALIPELGPPTPAKSSMKEIPASAPSKLQKKTSLRPSSAPATPIDDKPPPPPPHRTPSSNQVKFAPTPQFSPAPGVKRRSSSPLKHEYRPSSPSSESSYSEDDLESDLSEESPSSESDDELDDEDLASTFVSSVVAPVEEALKSPTALYSSPNGTIKPSESASQAPYRTVPQVVTVEAKPAKCVATIFTWSDHGAWQLLHPEDCSIVITPGLIAAYPMSSTHSTPDLPEDRPLVAQELTPLVPLRRGTALDITIRSPPTPASKLRPSANIMFRSRSSEECENLYNLINRSRINNPTYIALQNARPPTAEGSWAAAMDRQNSQRGTSASGWWPTRSKSYRASSRAQSTAGNTESSIGTISSVITAMKRFSGSYGILDKARSRMSQSMGSESNSLGSGESGPHSPPTFAAEQSAGMAGISNAKVRLYALQSKNKWLDLGSAKLNILPKEVGAVVAAPLMLHTGVEKRIVVCKKGGRSEGETLLDVTLPEPCFERWARTGIGVSVWVDVVAGGDGVGKTGGVTEKRVVKYMIQLKSERECAYTFSLLGKLRY